MARGDLTVVASVKRDLAVIACLDAGLARSGLAASALMLAGELDNRKNSATSKSMCARALAETLERLRALAPDEQKGDHLDDLSSRRDARRAGGAAS